MDDLLADHPVFNAINAGELDKHAFHVDTHEHDDEDEQDHFNQGQRKQTMVLKETDLYVAAGSQIRVASLASKHATSSKKQTFKTLNTPNIAFQIHQLALSPNGKLLAVAGVFQVAVLVLPRGGFSHLVPSIVDCKSIQVGPHYHASRSATPIAKVAWHPWGEAGTTLMVMTIDGRFREYDVSVDPSEPCQEIAFFPHANRRGSFIAQDESERMMVSFTLGKGKADWGPLTLYALTRSGDVYAICPYMPQNAAIPPSYIYTLEAFVSHKRQIAAEGTSSAAKTLSTMYDYQNKFVSGLYKQIPAGLPLSSSSTGQPRCVNVHPPSTLKARPARQGPFCFKPCPKELEVGDEVEMDNEATDMYYLASYESFSPSTDDEDDEDEDQEEDWDLENVGMMLITFKDGRVDICLDVEKIEAQWEGKETNKESSSMLLVHESIDLGLISMLKELTPLKDEPSPLSQLMKNHPIVYPDPIHDGVVYVYHAFGVHSLNIWPLLQGLRAALKLVDESSSSLESALRNCPQTEIVPVLSTFSFERRMSAPVISVTIPDDIYFTYSIFILTSAMRINCFPLTLRTEYMSRQLGPSTASGTGAGSEETSPWLKLPPNEPPSYISLLTSTPYTVPPVLSRSATSGLPSNPRLSLPPPPSPSTTANSNNKDDKFMLTPDTLRYLGTTVGSLQAQIRDVQLARRIAEARASLQKQEVGRLCAKAKEMVDAVEVLKGAKKTQIDTKLETVLESQKALLGRMETILRGIMMKASPELNESEKKWFEELGRMKREIGGVGKWDDQSLVVKTRVLETELERVLPLLKRMYQKEKQVKEKNAAFGESLGFSQAFELGKRSEEQQLHIERLEKVTVDLARKVDLDIGPPK